MTDWRLKPITSRISPASVLRDGKANPRPQSAARSHPHGSAPYSKASPNFTKRSRQSGSTTPFNQGFVSGSSLLDRLSASPVSSPDRKNSKSRPVHRGGGVRLLDRISRDVGTESVSTPGQESRFTSEETMVNEMEALDSAKLKLNQDPATATPILFPNNLSEADSILADLVPPSSATSEDAVANLLEMVPETVSVPSKDMPEESLTEPDIPLNAHAAPAPETDSHSIPPRSAPTDHDAPDREIKESESSPRPQPSPQISASDQARKLLLPVLMQNAQLRDFRNDHSPRDVEDEVRDVLTDDVCGKFIRMAKDTKRQMEDWKVNGNPPAHGGTQGVEAGEIDVSVTDGQSGVKASREDTAIDPSSSRHTSDASFPAQSQDRNPPPIDASFPQSKTNNIPKEPRSMRTENIENARNGNLMDEHHPEPLSRIARGPGYSYSLSRSDRLSRFSPPPHPEKRHRSPTDRDWPNSLTSYPSRSPPRIHHHRLYSLEERSWKRRRLSRERFRSPPPGRNLYSPEMDMRSGSRMPVVERGRSRISPDHLFRGRRRPSYADERQPERSSHSQSPQHFLRHERSRSRDIGRTPSSFSLKTPSLSASPFQDRSGGSSQHRDITADPPPPPNVSGITGGGISAAADLVQKDRTMGKPQPSDHTSISHALQQCPSLLASNTEGVPNPMSLQPPPPPPPTDIKCPVPGFWFVTLGSSHADILEVTFEVESEVYESIAPVDNSESTVSLHLVSIATADVTAFYSKLDPTATPVGLTDAFCRISPKMPPKGHLIIELNHGRANGRRFLPKDLSKDGGPIDVARHIHKGSNVVKFIQLVGLSGYMFMLQASKSIPAPKQVASNPWEDYLKLLRGRLLRDSAVDVTSDSGGPTDAALRFKSKTFVSVAPGIFSP